MDNYQNENDKTINEGYIGNDEFSVVETSLSRRFPMYKDGKPTKKTRQIEYKLIDGEASRLFKVVKSFEFTKE